MGGWKPGGGGLEAGNVPLCMYCLKCGGYNLMRWQLWSGCISHGMGA